MNVRPKLAALGLALMLVVAGCSALSPPGTEMEGHDSPTSTLASSVSSSPSPTPTCVPVFVRSHHNPSHNVTVTISKLRTNNTTDAPVRFNRTVRVDSSVLSVLRTDDTVFTEAGNYRLTVHFRDVNRTAETTLTVGDQLAVEGWREHALLEITIEPEGYEKTEFDVAFDVRFRDRPPTSQGC